MITYQKKCVFFPAEIITYKIRLKEDKIISRLSNFSQMCDLQKLWVVLV